MEKPRNQILVTGMIIVAVLAALLLYFRPMKMSELINDKQEYWSHEPRLEFRTVRRLSIMKIIMIWQKRRGRISLIYFSSIHIEEHWEPCSRTVLYVGSGMRSSTFLYMKTVSHLGVIWLRNAKKSHTRGYF